MTTTWRVEMFGWLRVYLEDRAVSRFPTKRTACLLSFLALYPDRSHPREFLADMLWPDKEWVVTRDRLNQALSSLRRQLEPPGTPVGSLILSDRIAVQLNPAVLKTDVMEFDEAVVRAHRTNNLEARCEYLAKAVKLYKGEFLPMFYEDWALAERQRTHDSYMSALNQLILALEESNDLGGALECARKLVAIDVLNEGAHLHLVRLYVKSGQLAMAVKQRKEMEACFREQLNSEPSTETQKLIQRFLQADPLQSSALSSSSTKVVAAKDWEDKVEVSQEPRKDNLPADLTRFFGRESQIEEILCALNQREARVVTLLGPGGAGKTRLAIETARRIAKQGDRTIWFVSLADLRSPELIHDTILLTIGISRSDTTAVEQLAEYFKLAGPCLVVLDNYEQLLPEGIDSLRPLLDRAPELSFILTSRHKIGIEGESEFEVIPLPVPSEPVRLEDLLLNPSVQLFVDRSQTLKPDFQVTKRNMEAVRMLVSRLEGIPLALELASTWSATMTPSQMLSEFTKRFHLLASRRRDIPKRHQTLWATIEDGFLKLPAPLQAFFVHLSIFHGGWTLEAAREICEAPEAMEMLTSLKERSLLTVETPPLADGAFLRFRLLDTIREFAWEKMPPADREGLQSRYTTYYESIAEQVHDAIDTDQNLQWLGIAELEHSNLLSVLDILVQEKSYERAMNMAWHLSEFWETKGYRKLGKNWFLRILHESEGTEIDPEAHANVLSGLALQCWALAEHEDALKHYEKALEIYQSVGNSLRVSEVLGAIGVVYITMDRREEAISHVQQGLAISQEIGHSKGIARNTGRLGAIYSTLKEYDLADGHLNEALGKYRELGSLEGICIVSNNLGVNSLNCNKPQLAEFFFQQSADIDEQLGRKSGLAVDHYNLACVANTLGDFSKAKAHVAMSLKIHMQIHDTRGLCDCLYLITALMSTEERYKEAAIVLGAATEIATKINQLFYLHRHSDITPMTETIKKALGDQLFTSMTFAGHSMNAQAAVDYVSMLLNDKLPEAKAASV